jgi:hypothetical protein
LGTNGGGVIARELAAVAHRHLEHP